MYQAFLVKYGEIGLKGNNRHIFENALKNRVAEKLAQLRGLTPEEVEAITLENGKRLYGIT